MVKAERDNFIKSINAEYDDYLQTVAGLYAFCKSAIWDEANKKPRDKSTLKIPGKVYKAGDKDKNALTPDGLVIINDNYAVVCEMKKHFQLGKTSHFDQLKKYDTPLVDFWENKNIPNHDLVLLTHYFSKTAASDAFNEWNKINKYERAMAIVEFSYSTQVKTYFTLAITTGRLSDQTHNEALRAVKKINDEHVSELLSKYKFYDGQPPLLYTMEVIYDYLLPLCINENEQLIAPSQGFSFTSNQVRDYLQKLCIPQNENKQGNTLPKISWVKAALDKFVEIGLGKKTGDEYILQLRTNSKDDTKSFLGKLIFKKEIEKKKKTKTSNQIDIFDQ